MAKKISYRYESEKIIKQKLLKLERFGIRNTMKLIQPLYSESDKYGIHAVSLKMKECTGMSEGRMKLACVTRLSQ